MTGGGEGAGMPDWVARIKDPERREYFNKIIAIDCPRTDIQWTKNGEPTKRPRIRDCFDHCDFCGRYYHAKKNGGGAAFMYCILDYRGERDLETGEITRDN